MAMLLCDSEEYRMSPPGNRNIKRFISFYIDDLKLYQPSHKNLKAMSEMIVQACYGVKKCAEINSLDKDEVRSIRCVIQIQIEKKTKSF